MFTLYQRRFKLSYCTDSRFQIDLEVFLHCIYGLHEIARVFRSIEIEISVDDDFGDYLDVLSWLLLLRDLNIFSHRTVIIVA